MKLRMKDSSKPWSSPCGSTQTVKMRSSVEDSCAQNVCLWGLGRKKDTSVSLRDMSVGPKRGALQLRHDDSHDLHIPRPRRHRDASVILGDSMFLPIHDDPQHALLHLKMLVLPQVDMQRGA